VSERSTGVIDWLFRNRATGRIVVAQAPNAALWVWIATAAARFIFDPSGTAASTLRWIGFGALVVWALDELIRGVNPWRRFLGAAVAAGQMAALW